MKKKKKISFSSEENLKLNNDEGCTALWIYQKIKIEDEFYDMWIVSQQSSLKMQCMTLWLIT